MNLIKLGDGQRHKRLLAWLVALSAALIGSIPAARAELQIEVTSGVRDPVPIAIVPFTHPDSAGSDLDVAAIVQHDLEGSGRFRALAREQMPAKPSRADQVASPSWKAAGSDYVVVGRTVALENGSLAVDFDLVNTLTGARLAGQRFTGAAGALRNAAHRVSDVIYQKILGVRGAFATRIAYVAVDGEPPTQRFQLIVADADGANQHMILESRFPLMSPAWSPDGQWLGYVSFETKHAAVYVQLVRTGERRQVSARAGVNGAPAWSPDGHKLALTLGGSGGNPDIYILDLATQDLTRITDDPAIDTEPEWAPDGKSLFFTSDRAGSPQIYQIATTANARPKRITFGGNYNARPRVSPDGSQLAMVTLDNGNYRIAVQDLGSGAVRVLSHGHLDESPSFAPNGATLIYSERESGRGSLATVSTDGLTGLRLKASQGEVREPAWGPFSP
ncbi:MAG TPA: Tol-Pal system beta propeller repeat protein TolB [Steroidobacteraceae bacterium]|jgi:TolB protein|nr:Tol-Pal system beta propeller repeat protein TolB [Steroidobacteraceae bacterium]